MKKIRKQLWLVLGLMVALSDFTSTYAQSIQIEGVNTIITAVPFLRIVPDARSGAMGDVGLAISPDANSMHFNASKLAFADKDVSISATYTPWLRALELQDVYIAYLSGYKKLSNQEAIGLSLRYFSLGNIQFTDENGQALGSDRPNEFEVSAAYSRKLTDKFSLGLALKFIYSRLASGQIAGGFTIRPGIAGAGDLSLTYKTPMQDNANLTIGAAISNLGSRISYTNSANRDFIPTNFGIGAAYEMEVDEHNSVVFALDINKLLVPTPDTVDLDGNSIPDYKEVGTASSLFSSFSDAPGGGSEEFNELNYSIGIEYWYDKQFAIRAGYYYEHPTKGNRQFFTVGLGLKYNIFGLNFSYLVPTSNITNPLNNTLRFSLVFDFGAFSVEEETPTTNLLTN